MGRNRNVGSPYQPHVVTASFQTNHAVDRYLVNAVPVTVTLDPYAVQGDQVVIEDITGAAASHPIVIDASAGQTILKGFGSSLSLATNYGAVELTYDSLEKGWTPLFLAGTETVTSNVLAPNVQASGAVPSAAAGPQAGTGATASVAANSTDTAGLLTLNTGTGAVSGVIATVTFATPYAAQPKSAVVAPANQEAAGVNIPVVIVSETGLTLVGTFTPASSNQYLWYYIVIG